MSWGRELWDQYDSIASHTQKGIDFLEKYGHFVDQRCKIEQEYATKLRRLVKTYIPKKKNDEDDYQFTCTKAYKNLLNELGDQAGQHELIAENLSTSVVLELSSLVKQLKEDRRKQLSDGTRYREQLQSSLSTLNKTRDKYDKAFGASERALDLYRKADADLNLSRAEVEKQRVNSTLKSQQCEDSKNEYANQLQKTNQTQTKYYTEDSPSVLQNFQDLDEKRIKCIKNFIIKSVEVEREVLPIVSQCLDCMEKSAESIDEKEDSRMVVEKYKSGFQPQGDIPFEDLSCSRQSTFQGGGCDKGDAASVNGSVMGSISQGPGSMVQSALGQLTISGDSNRKSILGTIGGRVRKRSGILGLFTNNKNGANGIFYEKEDFSDLPPNQRRKKLQAKIEEITGKICQETAARDGLMKMKQVYESNPALGDPMSIQGQLTDNGQRLDKLRAEQKKYQGYLDDMEGRPVNSSANSPHNSRLATKRNSSAAITATEAVKGHTGGGFRRNSVSDGADSLSRSASDSSVSNPGGSSHNNKNGNGGAMGNGSSNGLGSSSIADHRIGGDQVDLREDLSSDQGGTGSASGSSMSASAYRDANVDIAGPDDEEEEEFFEAEPLPILGRCKALYTFEVTSEGSIRMEENEDLWIIETDQGDGWTRVRRTNISTLDPMPEGFVPSSYIETCELFSTPRPA